MGCQPTYLGQEARLLQMVRPGTKPDPIGPAGSELIHSPRMQRKTMNTKNGGFFSVMKGVPVNTVG